jgi:uncharacterized protein YdhG (YjbR/CyaY superfamily)
MSHDAYLAALPDAQRALLGDLRRHLVSLLPGAEEVISYAMPGFRIGKVVVAGYAGFARNCGFYPHAGNIIPAFKAELDALGLRHTPGAVSFNPDRPLPHDLVTRMVAARLASAGLTPTGGPA